MSLPVVAIVGRPNVGKSTLFNRIVGYQKAVVHDRPGVTRDRLYEEAEVLDRRVLLIDTGGLEPEPDTDLLASMRHQSLVAVEEADVIVFVVDGRAGYTPADDEVTQLLRRAEKPVLLTVNKVDGAGQDDLAAEFWSVGLPDLVTVSAAHGRGIYELLDAIRTNLPPRTAAEDVEEEVEEPEEQFNENLFKNREAFDGPIRIAVIGRPNIGKSTLVNHLLGEDRHVVDDAPGTTMDPIDSLLHTEHRDYVLVDTAGVRRRTKIEDQLERYVSLRSIRAIERCHVCLLLIDATVGPTDQDAKLAGLVVDRGRALVVLINKWDLTKDDEDISSSTIDEALAQRLPHISWAPHLFISAKTGKGVHRVLPMVEQVFSAFDTRIGTSRLNRFLQSALHAHTPPQKHHRPVRIHFCTQARVRPPTFVFWANSPDGIAEPYRRYLGNRLREQFRLDGTPLRLFFRQKRKSGGEDAEG
ncbi:MAG: ribosome biogenesis GTPase Der [Myxococcales bacterium]|nr:ribosome biogenesis GTPase Der [Myxococcales bacterium]